MQQKYKRKQTEVSEREKNIENFPLSLANKRTNSLWDKRIERWFWWCKNNSCKKCIDRRFIGERYQRGGSGIKTLSMAYIELLQSSERKQKISNMKCDSGKLQIFPSWIIEHRFDSNENWIWISYKDSHAQRKREYHLCWKKEMKFLLNIIRFACSNNVIYFEWETECILLHWNSSQNRQKGTLTNRIKLVLVMSDGNHWYWNRSHYEHKQWLWTWIENRSMSFV